MFGKKKDVDNGEDRVRIINAIISFTEEIIDMYHHGIGPGALEPMTPALAKMMIADEVNRQLGEDRTNKDWQIARLRIAGCSQLAILNALNKVAPGKVIALRWVGKRDDEDDTVVYASVKCHDVVTLTKIIILLEENKLEVRDGTFGLFLR